jgi:hypothetical protein
VLPGTARPRRSVQHHEFAVWRQSALLQVIGGGEPSLSGTDNDDLRLERRIRKRGDGRRFRSSNDDGPTEISGWFRTDDAPVYHTVVRRPFSDRSMSIHRGERQRRMRIVRASSGIGYSLPSTDPHMLWSVARTRFGHYRRGFLEGPSSSGVSWLRVWFHAAFSRVRTAHSSMHNWTVR